MSQNPFEVSSAAASHDPRTHSFPSLRLPKRSLIGTTRVKKLRTEEPPPPPAESSKKRRPKKEQSQGLAEKLGDAPLRLIIVGHNPSEHAWKSGHYYSNPSNRMWKILKSTGIAPDRVNSAEDDDLMLPFAGVGFTDVGCGVPGTDSSQFSFKIRREWSQGFLQRLKAHIQRCNAELKCSCGACGAPRVIAFAGKTHFMAVHNALCDAPQRIKTVPFGKLPQPPEAWALPGETEIWVLPSTSGAAAMTNEEREAPFLALAERLRDFPWPDKRRAKCQNASNS